MIASYHIFEFTTGLYYPSISSLKAESIPEETRAVIMTLMRIPMNLGVGVIIWQVNKRKNAQDLYITLLSLNIDRRYVYINDVFSVWCDDLSWMYNCSVFL